MERHECYHMLIAVGILMLLTTTLSAQASSDSKYPLSFSGDLTPVSKYVWRGQRLTDGWSLQPSGTLGIGGFNMNVWGNMDLAAVNEGDALFLSENPSAPPGGGNNGLQGQLSEIDYTFSYSLDLKNAGVDFGTIFYTFPNRSASLPSTTEVYGGVTLSNLPLTPSATLYVDVDETGKTGSNGLYFLLGASHSFALGRSRFPGVDISSTLSFVNSGFGEYYYGASESGAHDFSFSVSAPINLGEHWSAGAFLTYSALLGDFRNHQYLNPRRVYLGTAGTPAGSADTVWGGFNLSVEF